jgi:hypothetical protein
MVIARIRLLVLVLVVVAGVVGEAHAQVGVPPQKPLTAIGLSGPRFGATFLSDGVREKLSSEIDSDVSSMVSQFGWQVEKQFLSSSSGLTAVSEWVLLAGGLDQGVFIPSLSWLVGMRTPEGLEFAVGPNVTAAGVGLAVAAGVTARAGDFNIPFNFAFVPSKSGMRMSMLVGFNFRR